MRKTPVNMVQKEERSTGKSNAKSKMLFHLLNDCRNYRFWVDPQINNLKRPKQKGTKEVNEEVPI